MSFETYRLIHFVGLVVLFLGLGGVVFHRGEGKAPGLSLVLHGLGWVAIIVAGFGMMAKPPGIGWSGWLIAKIVILVLLGAMPILVRKKIVPAGIAWLLVAVCGGVAAWLVVNRPF